MLSVKMEAVRGRRGGSVEEEEGEEDLEQEEDVL